jgi:formate hydrogenlyase subunit 3/multisubunit Na+/H+ antiporter MnhD subunit
MIALIGIVAALAASEAPRYVAHTAPGRFYPLFHLFVFTMLLAVSTDDVGLMWVAVEGTTLASVFLVNFERTRASLEASYKYLLICSVGIAIAFLGTVLVYFAGIEQFGDEVHDLRWTTLLLLAPGLSPRVIELAFVFLVVGYGTKAGLAPMHTWLPDAHSEAPAPVSALMSGVLLSVGVYAILRFKPVVDAAARPGFARGILLALGVLSVAVAAAFLWTSPNYKRMLAYSSVEHIGLVCLGLGFGGALAPPRRQPRPGQVDRLPAVGPHSRRVRLGRDRGGRRSDATDATDRHRLPGRDARAHRPAAVRTFRQRSDDLRRRLRAGFPGRRGRRVGPARDRLRGPSPRRPCDLVRTAGA